METTMRRYVYKAACFFLLVYLSSACVNARASKDGTVPIANGYELDLTTRSAVQLIDPGISAPEKKKFVQIEVTNVINPRRIPLSFLCTLSTYATPAGRKILSGYILALST